MSSIKTNGFLKFFYLGVMENLIDGSRVSDCPLPCLISYAQTKFIYEKVVENDTGLDISFSSRVSVTTTDLLRPTLTNFLSEVSLKYKYFFWN